MSTHGCRCHRSTCGTTSPSTTRSGDALNCPRYGRVVITAPQHGSPTGAVWRGGRESTWQAEVAQAIAEHAARRDQRNVWAIRFGTATLTDAESWLWSTVVMDAAATLLYPHRYPTS